MNKHGYRKRSFFTKKKKVIIEPPQKQEALEALEKPAAKELTELNQVLNADLPESLKLKFCKMILDKAV